jgi:glucosamine--fructose-6-phosphate aminotransferase (isomerizing)
MTNLREEILEQPEVIHRLLEVEESHVRSVARVLRKYDPRFVVLAARGSSDNAARYAKYLLGNRLGVQVALATPSLFTLYRRPPALSGSLVIGISQSGQSEDIRAVVAEARRQGVPTIAITNDPKSPLAAEAEHTLPVHAGVEHSVPATKTYTSQLAMLALLAACWTDDAAMMAQLKQVPEHIEAALSLESIVEASADTYRHMQQCAVLGRGYNYATAYEIALKLKETCLLPAEPYSPADFQHGPVALVGPSLPVFIVAPSGQAFQNLFDFAGEVRERGADIFMISDQRSALDLATISYALPSPPAEWVSPLMTVVPGQLFALHLALARGLDPDQPPGLHKVTSTL